MSVVDELKQWSWRKQVARGGGGTSRELETDDNSQRPGEA